MLAAGVLAGGVYAVWTGGPRSWSRIAAVVVLAVATVLCFVSAVLRF